MANYRLVLDGLAAFVVDIASTSGGRSMRRFPTEAAALTRIAEQKFRDFAAETAKGAVVTNRLPRSRDPIALANPIGDSDGS
jgi:hypothetical protein